MTARPAWIVTVAIALSAAACSASNATKGPTIASLQKGGIEYSLVQAQSSLAVGTSRFVFGLVSRTGKSLTGGAPQVWVAKTEQSKPLGPFTAHWLVWSPPLADTTATPPIPGFYRADVRVPGPGNWMILAKANAHGKPIVGTAAMPVTNKPVAAIGSKALSEATPVATTPEEAAKIDTREPPSPLHYISLDQALTSGLPTVVVFGTPLLCQSRICGPVVDEVLGVYNGVGRAKANFIHVEIYPERDANKPAPQFLAWGFESEPWTLVIDKSGVIQGRFEGPVVASEIEAALTPLLST